MYSEIKAGADSIKEVRRGGEVLWQRYPSPIVINKNTFRRYFRPNFEPLGHLLPFTSEKNPVATNYVHLEPGREVKSVEFYMNPVDFIVRLVFERRSIFSPILFPYNDSLLSVEKRRVKDGWKELLNDVNRDYNVNKDRYFYLAMSPQEITDTGLLFAKYDIEIRVEYK
ncbi:MAG: hypothetical protein SOW18_06790 [Peptoniphilus sp.]|nr:hypothetical protein [Peptoniphilus sp.]MDY3119225.1 hypothetical protein [Peptoniphilus sp.]